MPKKPVKEPRETDDIPVATISQSVIESYIFATGHRNLSIYSERLLLQLVKIAQQQVLGLSFKAGRDCRQIEVGKLGERLIEIDARSILGSETQTNYSYAKKAVLELMSKQISHERPKMVGGKPVYNADGSLMYEFEAHTLLNDVYINRKPGTIIVNVNKTTWETLLDFSKGFRRYDLQMALSFSHSCTLRMYKLISGQGKPIEFSIQELREQWNLVDKYKNNNDFIRYTIDAAKKELDDCSPWTFDYSVGTDMPSGGMGRSRITRIKFYPIHQPRFDSTSVVANMVHPKDHLGKEVIDALVGIGFSMAQIRAHIVLFKTASKYFNLETFLSKIKPSALRARTSPQGYVVNAVKKHLAEDFNVKVSKNQILEETGDLTGNGGSDLKMIPRTVSPEEAETNPEKAFSPAAACPKPVQNPSQAPSENDGNARKPRPAQPFSPAAARPRQTQGFSKDDKNAPKTLGELLRGTLFEN